MNCQELLKKHCRESMKHLVALPEQQHGEKLEMAEEMDRAAPKAQSERSEVSTLPAGMNRSFLRCSCQ